ncbi:nucleotidyltransferase domain-containing protein [Bacillus sp. S17B2]|uniref:nucleotidyltransferase domain-containing protein n=1 Tax=Bacillus sp. S17B2 TaxID=2918907 RepID=UPI00227ECE1F|nr:nucleotidyltransferase domain-containing protein [Bacillus sp. S17B2]
MRDSVLGTKNLSFNWLEDRTILLAPTGSYAYGTNTENSDKDYKGVCIPPEEYFLGLKAFNEYNNTGGKNFKNSRDDVDISIMHINKFVKEAAKGNPTSLELLFMDENSYLKMTDLGKILIDNRLLFLSKRVKSTFGGFAKAQMQKLITKKGNNTGRQELVQQYGYDTKFFMHSVRMLTSAIEILETGNYRTYRPDRDMLLDCRNGKYSYEDAIEIIKRYDSKLQEAYLNSSLPDEVDYEKVNKMLIDINREALGLYWSK